MLEGKGESQVSERDLKWISFFRQRVPVRTQLQWLLLSGPAQP